jgi:hypoxanthine-DNA glycosylase
MGDLFGEPLHQQPYPRRLQRLLAHRVGLWDVIDACDREGSLDSAITNVRANPFARLERFAPRLADVAFNGGTAGRFARAFAKAGYGTSVLPSSSPAHAGRTYEQKLALWRAWWQRTDTA